MLVITTGQMKEISAALEARYVRDCCAMLRAGLFNFFSGLDEDAAAAFVRAGIKKAKRYRITDRADVPVFLKYQAAFGPDFDEPGRHEALRKILLIRNLSGSAKVARMLEKVQPQNAT